MIIYKFKIILRCVILVSMKPTVTASCSGLNRGVVGEGAGTASVYKQGSASRLILFHKRAQLSTHIRRPRSGATYRRHTVTVAENLFEPHRHRSATAAQHLLSELVCRQQTNIEKWAYAKHSWSCCVRLLARVDHYLLSYNGCRVSSRRSRLLFPLR
ncbi:hypothetical protein DL93DRAFT_1583996 [Clavulina sp. PMI_390]|nr:hypothetical protein DL93DRAFT_1583996 [Clavulina sp. PMI_390]